MQSWFGPSLKLGPHLCQWFPISWSCGASLHTLSCPSSRGCSHLSSNSLPACWLMARWWVPCTQGECWMPRKVNPPGFQIAMQIPYSSSHQDQRGKNPTSRCELVGGTQWDSCWCPLLQYQGSRAWGVIPHNRSYWYWTSGSGLPVAGVCKEGWGNGGLPAQPGQGDPVIWLLTQVLLQWIFLQQVVC
jgi:hypothetical protein